MTIDKKEQHSSFPKKLPTIERHSAPPLKRQFGQKMTTKGFTDGKVPSVVDDYSLNFKE